MLKKLLGPIQAYAAALAIIGGAFAFTITKGPELYERLFVSAGPNADEKALFAANRKIADSLMAMVCAYPEGFHPDKWVTTEASDADHEEALKQWNRLLAEKVPKLKQLKEEAEKRRPIAIADAELRQSFNHTISGINLLIAAADVPYPDNMTLMMASYVSAALITEQPLRCRVYLKGYIAKINIHEASVYIVGVLQNNYRSERSKEVERLQAYVGDDNTSRSERKSAEAAIISISDEREPDFSKWTQASLEAVFPE